MKNTQEICIKADKSIYVASLVTTEMICYNLEPNCIARRQTKPPIAVKRKCATSPCDGLFAEHTFSCQPTATCKLMQRKKNHEHMNALPNTHSKWSREKESENRHLRRCLCGRKQHKRQKKNKFSLAHMPFKSNGRKAVCVNIGSHNFTLIPFQTRREISPKPILSFCFLSLQLHFASQQQEPQMQESFALRCAQSSAEDKKKTHKPNRCQWRGRVEPHSFFTVSTLFSLTLPFTW